MTSLPPRMVLVTRQTELAALLARHATHGQIAFFLQGRGQSYDEVVARDASQARAITEARAAMPQDWSFAQVERSDLDRFLFFPNDIVVGLGQDGLIANLAKYLDDQPVIGVTPEPEASEGILTPHAVIALPDLLRRCAAGDIDISFRTMVKADVTGDGGLYALNEIFIGHRSHQSARYDLTFGDQTEFQSSSGVILTTGTGMTGWARSIMAATGTTYDLPVDATIAAFFVREPWPSQHSGCDLRSGMLNAQTRLTLNSRINEGGVIFADGIEQDFLRFDWGHQVNLSVAERRLNLVAG